MSVPTFADVVLAHVDVCFKCVLLLVLLVFCVGTGNKGINS